MRALLCCSALLLLALPSGLRAVSPPHREGTSSSYFFPLQDDHQVHEGQNDEFGRVDLPLNENYGPFAQYHFGQAHQVPPLVDPSIYSPMGGFAAGPQSSHVDYSLPPLPPDYYSEQQFTAPWMGFASPQQEIPPPLSHPPPIGYDAGQPVHHAALNSQADTHTEPFFTTTQHLPYLHPQTIENFGMPLYPDVTTYSHNQGSSGSGSHHSLYAHDNTFQSMQQTPGEEASGPASASTQRVPGGKEMTRIEALVFQEWAARGLAEGGKGAREVAAHVAEMKVDHPEISLDIAYIAGKIVRNQVGDFNPVFIKEYTEWSTKYTDKIRRARRDLERDHPEWDAAQVRQAILSGLHSFSDRITAEFKKSEEKLIQDVWNDFYPNHLKPLLTSESRIPLSAIAQAATGYSYGSLTKKRTLVVIRKYLYHHLLYRKDELKYLSLLMRQE